MNNPFETVIVWGSINKELLRLIAKLVSKDIRVIMYSSVGLSKRSRIEVKELCKDFRFVDLSENKSVIGYNLVVDSIENTISNVFDLPSRYKVSGFIFRDELKGEILVSVPEEMKDLIEITIGTNLSNTVAVESVSYDMYVDSLKLKILGYEDCEVRSINFVNYSILEWLFEKQNLLVDYINMHNVEGEVMLTYPI